MYQKILVALDHTDADETLLPHISPLASLLKSRLLLVHVADGWAACHYDQLQLAESEEMKEDADYLEKIAVRLREQTKLEVTVKLALGSPHRQIVSLAEQEGCDLIAMTSHGHRLIGDLILGNTIDKVRHQSRVPILVVRAENKT